MKYIFILLFTFQLHSQDSVYIKKIVDDMTDNVYYLPSRMLVVYDEDRKSAVKIDIAITERLTPSGLIGKLVNLGNCSEKDELIIMFRDSSKMKVVSWNKFNCEGTAYFSPLGDDWTKLRTMKIIKLMIRNGRTFETLVEPIEKRNQDYFLQTFYAIDNKKIRAEK